MNESMQEYRTLLSDNPAKAERQLYKLTKKGDLQALHRECREAALKL